jgi:uncharacterized protein YjbJ (UPF0337 family)
LTNYVKYNHKPHLASPEPALAPKDWLRVGNNFQSDGETTMDKDRIEGSGKQAKGAIKEAAGKLTGDAKLKAEGKADKMAGKVQNAAGSAKDAMRE